MKDAHIGRQIAAHRKKNKLTQGQLADLVGVAGKTVINNYEHGDRMPSIKMLNKIAGVLGCSARVILVRDDRSNKKT